MSEHTNKNKKPVLRLASASPRRRQLLDLIGVPHVVTPADIDETPRAGEAADDYVLRLAREKAEAVWALHQDLPVLAADTTVVRRRRDPRQTRVTRLMLHAHAGHTVGARAPGHTGVCVVSDRPPRVVGIATTRCVPR